MLASFAVGIYGRPDAERPVPFEIQRIKVEERFKVAFSSGKATSTKIALANLGRLQTEGRRSR